MTTASTLHIKDNEEAAEIPTVPACMRLGDAECRRAVHESRTSEVPLLNCCCYSFLLLLLAPP
jgi:hypothetical protein